jgi:phage tail sheath protein FI
VEILSGISPATIVADVNARSNLIRLTANELPATVFLSDLTLPTANHGPRYFEWNGLNLADGVSVPPTQKEYLDAVQCFGDEVEIALTACPDLHCEEMLSEEQRTDVITALLVQADNLHDREVILDVPPTYADPLDAVKWASELRQSIQNENLLRGGAVYYPRVRVLDPLGGVTAPLRCVPCSGSVLGVISRLDQQLGPYATPANAQIYEAFDLSKPLNAKDQTTVYQGGINLLRCSPSNGLLVWGGRVLGEETEVTGMLGGFLAHRRLIQVLVRAIRRVAEPLVFETNGPRLWLGLVRGITSVLLEAYRAGALKGATPDEAFRVTCDQTTNPPENIDNGLCFCEILVSPAAPMEFITLRVAVSNQGKLEVFES